MSDKDEYIIDLNKVDEWSDEECLTYLSKFLDRVDLTTQFLQNDDGLITHIILIIQSGDKVIASEPDQLQWPLQTMPVPEAFEGKLN